MAHIRIAKVTYEHHDLEFTKEGTLSIGQQIDQHIVDVIRSGGLVSEVSLFFDTEVEQHNLVKAYEDRSTDRAVAAYSYTDDDYHKPEKSLGDMINDSVKKSTKPASKYVTASKKAY